MAGGEWGAAHGSRRRLSYRAESDLSPTIDTGPVVAQTVPPIRITGFSASASRQVIQRLPGPSKLSGNWTKRGSAYRLMPVSLLLLSEAPPCDSLRSHGLKVLLTKWFARAVAGTLGFSDVLRTPNQFKNGHGAGPGRDKPFFSPDTACHQGPLICWDAEKDCRHGRHAQQRPKCSTTVSLLQSATDQHAASLYPASAM
ncbi:hypothetical protein BXY53_0789 [Dichotomicrobium thermohalophilum]|uniref:Uncharacterized protein n=1 Tax=Dichotomicrobium thermohalophilum TaxID=933063 RepID=A0A397Q459_9HYPH|nr:hypothetical protein BXY53_0789 [Dichotomicrobium thermohalophilum]